MAEVVLFHHCQGQTPGFLAFAEELRGAGHTVFAPDLYDGRVFETLEEGLEHAHALDPQKLTERGVAEAQELPADVVYAGFSLGVMPAQRLAQTRQGAKGALLFHSCIPPEFFGGWPTGLEAQVHAMDADPFFTTEGDIDAARELVAEAPGTELFLYPGDRHLFADSSLDSYDPEAANLLTRRVLDFLSER